MKKYLLTALLWVFGLFIAFASADTVDWVSSSSAVHCYSFSDTDWVVWEDLNYFDWYDWFDSDSTMYSCVLTNDTPVYVGVSYLQEYWNPDFLVSSNGACWTNPVWLNDGGWYFYSDSNFSVSKTISWKVCFSNSPMTYTSSSGGWSSSSSSSQILSGWISQLSPVISSISSVMSEFIPYVVYIWIGILLVTLWFKAIKRLVNWLSSKITRYFK